VAEAVHMFRNC